MDRAVNFARSMMSGCSSSIAERASTAVPEPNATAAGHATEHLRKERARWIDYARA